MVVWIFLLGLAIGSFINVLIDRLPRGEDIVGRRSYCDYCRKTLRWFELIPLVSWLIQAGKCRRCHRRLSLQYPLVELVAGFGFSGLYLIFSHSLILLFSYSLIFMALLVIFVSDLKYQIIPDSMVGLGIVGALLRLYFLTVLSFQFPVLGFFYSALGAASLFFLLWWLSRGRAMGLGDVKLALLLGLLLGFPRVVVALYSAFLTGATVGVILLIVGKKRLESRIAFGPFLIVGLMATIIWGDAVITWWRKLL